jgi:F0F1-type ATP synthase assembly protein I
VAGPSDRERRSRDENEQRLSSLAEGYQKAAPYIGASTSLVAAVGGFALAGYWADGKLGHTTPWLLIVGAVLGMIGGFVSFFKTVLGTTRTKK